MYNKIRAVKIIIRIKITMYEFTNLLKSKHETLFHVCIKDTPQKNHKVIFLVLVLLTYSKFLFNGQAKNRFLISVLKFNIYYHFSLQTNLCNFNT